MKLLLLRTYTNHKKIIILLNNVSSTVDGTIPLAYPVLWLMLIKNFIKPFLYISGVTGAGNTINNIYHDRGIISASKATVASNDDIIKNLTNDLEAKKKKKSFQEALKERETVSLLNLINQTIKNKGSLDP